MHLDGDTVYHFKAYHYSEDKDFNIKLGLFSGKTDHTEATLQSLAKDEVQKLSIGSTLRPSLQVRELKIWKHV